MIQFFYLFRQKEIKENKLIQQQLETQHAFLKTQVNPHFLFTALNNLYSMAIEKDSKELAEGINNLSGIMRYLTYESSQEKVAIEKEIKQQVWELFMIQTILEKDWKFQSLWKEAH